MPHLVIIVSESSEGIGGKGGEREREKDDPDGSERFFQDFKFHKPRFS